MTLREHQCKFSRMVAQLLIKAFELGYEVTLGYSQRCDNCPVGHEYSLHKLKLALDINIFKDGKYLSATNDHKELGEFWESIGGSWGGRFKDGNHYSLSYKGMR